MPSIRAYPDVQVPTVWSEGQRSTDWWQCGRKLRYPTKRRAVQSAQRGLRERGEWLHAYFCRHCGGWHIGHMSASRYIREHSRRQSRLTRLRLQRKELAEVG